jgi:phosphohistidine swiveling domain-containing protein
MAARSLDSLRDLIERNEWVKGAVNYDEDLHFSSFYLRASHASRTKPLYPGYTSILAFFEGCNERYYLLKSECTRTATVLIQRALAQPAWLPKILKKITRLSDALTDIFDPATNADSLASLSLAELSALYSRHAAAQRALYTYARLPEALDRGDSCFTTYLKSCLRERGLALSACEDAFAALSEPAVPSVLYQELIEFEDIVLAARADEPLVVGGHGRFRMFLRPQTLRRLRQHLAKWQYLSYHGYGRREPATLGQLVERLAESLKNPRSGGRAPRRAGSVKGGQQPALNASGSKEALGGPRLALGLGITMDRAHQALFAVYPQIGAAKLYRRHAQLRNFYYLDMLLGEIACRLDVTEWTLRCMLPEEIEASLKTGKPANPAAGERAAGCLFALLPKHEQLLTGSRVKVLRDLFEAKTSAPKGGNVLKGTVACRGAAAGPCKILIRAADHYDDFVPGSILVSESTDPDLLMFVRKAGAVLTEQGGVTSHAALICRELGVPAVVGIDGLLGRVRDGDRVEVDAQRGLVTLIQDKPPPPETVFSEGELRLPERVGGKAFNLGRVRSLGFPVPEYVVLNYDGVSRVLNRSSNGAGKNLARWALGQLNLPPAAKLALRSSACDEDQENGSGAGAYRSLLNVDRDQIVAALGEFVHCNRGARYRGSIIVQRMIEADYAGVCLTEDPRTGQRHTVILELVAGGNQSVTQGTAVPERILVDRLTGDVVENRKGTDFAPVLDLADMVRQFLVLEAHFGGPVDIEWALKDRQLYVLQARPIVKVPS